MADASAYNSGESSRFSSDQYSHLPALQQSIARYLKENCTTEEGIHVSAIARAVGNGSDALKIRSGVPSVLVYLQLNNFLATHLTPSWIADSSTPPSTSHISCLPSPELASVLVPMLVCGLLRRHGGPQPLILPLMNQEFVLCPL